MEEPEREEVSDVNPRRLRQVAFPVADEITQQERAAYDRRVTVAAMLKVTPEALEAEEAKDDVPNFWPLPLEARADKPKDKDMANENAEKVLAVGWDEVDKSVGAGGQWMKWTSGQVIKLNVCGIPKHVEREYQGEMKKRISVEVFVPGEGVKTWEMAPATWKDLREERDMCKTPFADTLFSVKRTGEGKETRYKFRPERVLDANEVNERSTVAYTATVSGDVPF